MHSSELHYSFRFFFLSSSASSFFNSKTHDDSAERASSHREHRYEKNVRHRLNKKMRPRSARYRANRDCHRHSVLLFRKIRRKIGITCPLANPRRIVVMIRFHTAALIKRKNSIPYLANANMCYAK